MLKGVVLATPIMKGDLAYKMVDQKLVLLGEGSVELCVDKLGGNRYYLNGLLHNTRGPALITSCKSYREWYVHGKQIHPAWLKTRGMG